MVIVGAYAPNSGSSEEEESLRGGDESVVYSRSARISRSRRVAEFLEEGFTVLYHLKLSAVRSENPDLPCGYSPDQLPPGRLHPAVPDMHVFRP